MDGTERNGKRKPRNKSYGSRVPELGYYYIITDTEKTEKNYMIGLRESIPTELQNKLVIKVIKTETKNLVEEAQNYASLNPQFGEIWIIFDRDKVTNFDQLIYDAQSKNIRVAWTNPCIEEWFYAYFGKMPTYDSSTKCCSEFKKIYKQKTNQSYSKSDSKIYQKLNKYGNEDKAINTAKKVAYENQSKGKIKPSEQIPGTAIHLLIEEIKTIVNRQKERP